MANFFLKVPLIYIDLKMDLIYIWAESETININDLSKNLLGDIAFLKNLQQKLSFSYPQIGYPFAICMCNITLTGTSYSDGSRSEFANWNDLVVVWSSAAKGSHSLF